MWTFLTWLILFLLCWPLALLALVLYPVVWLLMLPFRLLGIAVDSADFAESSTGCMFRLEPPQPRCRSRDPLHALGIPAQIADQNNFIDAACHAFFLFALNRKL